MANNRVTKGLKDIADAIRAKTGDDGKMTAAEMPEKIEAIPVGIDPEGTKEIGANGEFNVREFESVNVNVPVPDGYIKPEGTKYIGNGDVSRDSSTTIDVTDYEDVHISSVKDLCSDSYHASSDDVYDSYGHYNPEIYIAGYSSINVQDLGGGPSYETLYSGYYYVSSSASVQSTYDFSEISTPRKIEISGNEGLLVVNENSYSGYFPEGSFKEVDIRDNILALEVGASTQDFEIYHYDNSQHEYITKKFKITRTE